MNLRQTVTYVSTKVQKWLHAVGIVVMLSHVCSRCLVHAESSYIRFEFGRAPLNNDSCGLSLREIRTRLVGDACSCEQMKRCSFQIMTGVGIDRLALELLRSSIWWGLESARSSLYFSSS